MRHEFEVLSGAIIEAAIDVHKQLGPGYLETIYENAMKFALGKRALEFTYQQEVRVFYEAKASASAYIGST